MLHTGSFRTAETRRNYDVSRNLMNDIVATNEIGKIAFIVAEHDVNRFSDVSTEDLIEIYDQGFSSGKDVGRDSPKRKIAKALKAL